jgi:hypothetical protein
MYHPKRGFVRLRERQTMNECARRLLILVRLVPAAPGHPQEAVTRKILSTADPWRQTTLTGIRLRADRIAKQLPG